jgi:hypothetical protein
MSERKPPYGVAYRRKGREYSFQIWAESWEDAEDRLRSIAMTGRVYGSNLETVPANSLTLPFAALWASLTVRWRNWRRGS